MCSYSFVIVFVMFGMTIAQINFQQAIGFPEPEEDVNLANKDKRQPVYIPAMCPANELYYPGDQIGQWICDCRPGFLYHPQTGKCWAAYRKGPCDEGHYLVLPQDSVIPTCETNPCNVDNEVMYNGSCEKLNTMAPCKSMWPIAAALTVNSTNLKIACERLNP